MDDIEFLALLDAHKSDAVEFHSSEIVQEQEEALKYYDGRPFGDEVDGRSQVVSRDVAEVVDWIMPDMLRIFGGGNRVVFFRPNNENDVENAEQATEYINHVFFVDNNGFEILHDFIKDGALQKNGVLKTWWEETDKVEEHRFHNLSLADLSRFEGQDDVEVMDLEERDLTPEDVIGMSLETQALYSDGKAYDFKVRREFEQGRVKVDVVPPEEFLIASRSRSLDEAPYVAHRTEKTLSDLISEGLVSKEEAPTLSGNEDIDKKDRENTRFEDPHDSEPEHGLMREVTVYEEYVRADRDDDGYAELIQVIRVGEDILLEEVVGDHPFVDWTPNRIPHRFWGKSIADDVLDLQRINSVLQRQLLDNLYLANNPRKYVNALKADDSTIDEILNDRVGGVVIGNGPMQEVIGEMTTPFVAGNAFQMLEWMESRKEKRTGVIRLSQGLDEDTINPTATGITKLMEAAQGRKELVARRIAEALKRLFSKMLKITKQYQDFRRVVRLRDKFVSMDPRFWNAEMDVDVLVGLGSGNKDQHIASLGQILQLQQTAMSSGLYDPGIMRKKLFNTVEDLIENMGLASVTRYFPDPESPEGQPPPPQPSEAQIEARTDIQKEIIKANTAIREALIRDGQKRDEVSMEAALKQLELQAEAFLKGFEVREDPPNVDTRINSED